MTVKVVDFSSLTDPDRDNVINQMIKALKELKKSKDCVVLVLSVGETPLNSNEGASYYAYGNSAEAIGLLEVVKHNILLDEFSGGDE